MNAPAQSPPENETLASWRERDHDDLVLAVAMAAWVSQRRLPFWMR
jgi:hypothetical protein